MEKTAAERVRSSHSSKAVFGSGYGKRMRINNRCYPKFLHFLSKYSDLIEKVLAFRDDRDWKQYHSGKDLSISISLEASELLEIFQWSKEEVDKYDKIENIKEELADVLIYCYMLADYYQLNVDEIIESKLIKNLKKYPDGKDINLRTK